MKTETVTFAHKAETKNKQRFDEVGVAEGQVPVIGGLYVRKDVAERYAGVKVTLEFDGERTADPTPAAASVG